MYDEINLHRYGTPLPELEEDTVPSKKPIRPEDQIVTDENGKRRFHGAFTGGFSAGYWNTVGSQEGWTPSSFKSSRAEKAAQRATQRPEDFMDDEDRGEFGIAPQRLQARPEYANDDATESRKRKLIVPNMGPIPGQPVLEQLLRPRKEKIGVRILKSMGWRQGQGIGPRQTRKEKKQTKARNRREMYLMQQYGYEPGERPPRASTHSADDDDDENERSSTSGEECDDEMTFAPDDYEPFICQPKIDRFGLGYREHLSRDPVLSQSFNSNGSGAAAHINLFEVLDKNNKKVTITGKAFGVGALEEEDEDIYARDDMTKYDFSLGDNKPKRKKKDVVIQDRLVVDGFEASKNPTHSSKHYNVDMAENFKPRNWTERKSRFEPMDPQKAHDLERKFKHVEFAKTDLNPNKRAELLGEAATNDNRPSTSAQARQTQQETEFRIGGGSCGRGCTSSKASQSPTLVSPKAPLSPTCSQAKTNIRREWSESERNKTSSIINNPTIFKPFTYDENKQRRYEEFLMADVKSEADIADFLNKIQPLHFGNWDREMEKKEFMQASKMFKPLDGQMSERFVSEAAIGVEQKVSVTCIDSAKPHVPVRSKTMWKPCSILCKRFNIPEPYVDTKDEQKTQKSKCKMSVFDYLEDSLNKKNDFKTPDIIPRKQQSSESTLKESTSSSTSSESTTSIPTSTASVVVIKHVPNIRSGSEVRISPRTSKTELENRVDEVKDKPVWEKLELFKSIFVDSSDEESDNKRHVTVITNTESDTKANKCRLEETIPNHQINITKCVNVLRNNSPPRGIFASLLTAPAQNANNCETVLSGSVGTLMTDPTTTTTSTNTISDANACNESTSLSPGTREVRTSASNNSSKSVLDDISSTKLIYTSKKYRHLNADKLNMNEDDQRETTRSVEVLGVYGPQVPEHIAKMKKGETLVSVSTVKEDLLPKNIEKKLMDMLAKQHRETYKSKKDDEWVEKKVNSTSCFCKKVRFKKKTSEESLKKSKKKKHKKQDRCKCDEYEGKKSKKKSKKSHKNKN